MAPPAFSAETHAEDVRRLRAGHAEDDEAMRLFLSAPGASERLGAYLKRNGDRHARTRTMGPSREAIRVLILEDHPHQARIRQHLASADAHYWFVVQRHDPFLRKQAAYFQKTVACSTDVEDVLTLAKLGAFAAALRFDRDDIHFCTYAKHWIGARIQRNRDMPGAFRAPVIRWKDAPSVVSLDEALTVDGGGTLQDVLPSEKPSAEEDLVLHDGIGSLERALAGLSARDQDILRRHAAGESFSQIAGRYDLSRERIRQIERHAMQTIRARMGLEESVAPPPSKDEVDRARQDRDTRILLLRQEGLSYAKIADRVGMSGEAVRKVLLASEGVTSEPLNAKEHATAVPPYPPVEASVQAVADTQPSDRPFRFGAEEEGVLGDAVTQDRTVTETAETLGLSPDTLRVCLLTHTPVYRLRDPDAPCRPFRFSPSERRVLKDAVFRDLSVTMVACIFGISVETLRLCLRTHTPVYTLRDPAPISPTRGRPSLPLQADLQAKIRSAILAKEPLTSIARRLGVSVYAVTRIRQAVAPPRSVPTPAPLAPTPNTDAARRAGRARMATLSAKDRSQLARNAAMARWARRTVPAPSETTEVGEAPPSG